MGKKINFHKPEGLTLRRTQAMRKSVRFRCEISLSLSRLRYFRMKFFKRKNASNEIMKIIEKVKDLRGGDEGFFLEHGKSKCCGPEEDIFSFFCDGKILLYDKKTLILSPES